MAKYEIPPDPRDPDSDYSSSRHRFAQQQDGREPTPWLWLGLGLLVTIGAIFISLWFIDSMLIREPLQVADIEPPPPTVIRLTAPPTLEPTATTVLPTPTPIPTLTPEPTPDRSIIPEELTVGFYAAVTGTDGIGVSVRGGPSTANVRVTIADEGAALLILDGPQENEGFEWWQIRLVDGTEGWVAGGFLEPTAAP